MRVAVPIEGWWSVVFWFGRSAGFQICGGRIGYREMLVPLNFMSTSVSKLPVPQDALRDGIPAPADPSKPPPQTDRSILPPEGDEAAVPHHLHWINRRCRYRT